MGCRAIISILALLGGFIQSVPAAPDECRSWPLWERYRAASIQADGRVIDFRSDDGITTSEGQAYSLFFALVANDAASFRHLLTWTTNNLAQGDLAQHLPAWQWGRRADGTWGVRDTTPAADADMWLAYTLLEAGRLWQSAAYRELGLRLLNRVREREAIRLPGFGWMILPAPDYFALPDNRWRINPSYLPLPLLRAFAGADPAGPWNDIAMDTIKMLEAAAPHGFVPDWVMFDAAKGWLADPEHGSVGSYGAIRVYLWAGMLHPDDPARGRLLQATRGMTAFLANGDQRLPETFDAARGQPVAEPGHGVAIAPPGFSAALLPLLRTYPDPTLFERQEQRVMQAPALQARAPSDGAAVVSPGSLSYYDVVLSLFGTGWTEGRFRFDVSGNLQLPRAGTCIGAAGAALPGER